MEGEDKSTSEQAKCEVPLSQLTVLVGIAAKIGPNSGITPELRCNMVIAVRTPHAPLAREYQGPESVADVRRDITAWLTGIPIPDTTADDIRLMASELASNAIRYSASGNKGKTYQVRALYEDSHIRVEVHDLGSAYSVPHQRHDPDGLHGRGLNIVDALATSWGVHQNSVHCTIVWFEVNVTSA